MTQTAQTLNQNWFSIEYTPSAPSALPPIIQAERVLRYRDETGIWFIALWDRYGRNGSECLDSTCILRVPDIHVVAVTRHQTMGEAAGQPSTV